MYAELYLMSDLKKKCGSFISECLTTENVLYYFSIARQYGLSRLETFSVKLIAQNLEMVIEGCKICSSF